METAYNRYTARLPTVITTALPSDKLDERLASRILDETHSSVMPILAPSYRVGRPMEKTTKSMSKAVKKRG